MHDLGLVSQEAVNYCSIKYFYVITQPLLSAFSFLLGFPQFLLERARIYRVGRWGGSFDLINSDGLVRKHLAVDTSGAAGAPTRRAKINLILKVLRALPMAHSSGKG